MSSFTWLQFHPENARKGHEVSCDFDLRRKSIDGPEICYNKAARAHSIKRDAMAESSDHRPKQVHQVMVSSTFKDLEEHRAALIEAIHKYGLHANVMEHSDAEPARDMIQSSLEMVRDSAGYICLISLRYGQTPHCPDRNPTDLSITELEFNEAVKLHRPILLYLMDEDYPLPRKFI